jgi:hypothetical protein
VVSEEPEGLLLLGEVLEVSLVSLFKAEFGREAQILSDGSQGIPDPRSIGWLIVGILLRYNPEAKPRGIRDPPHLTRKVPDRERFIGRIRVSEGFARECARERTPAEFLVGSRQAEIPVIKRIS